MAKKKFDGPGADPPVLDWDGQPARCISKAKEGEPLFVLRAQDRFASVLVKLWAELAELHGCPREKVAGAMELAEQMEAWGEKNGSKWPD